MLESDSYSEGGTNVLANAICSFLLCFAVCSGDAPGSSNLWQEAATAGALRDQIRREWAEQGQAARRIFAHRTIGISREHFCHEFPGAALAGGGPQWRHS